MNKYRTRQREAQHEAGTNKGLARRVRELLWRERGGGERGCSPPNYSCSPTSMGMVPSTLALWSWFWSSYSRPPSLFSASAHTP